MADKLLVVLANADPQEAACFVTPLAQATVAAAMEYEVEVILSGRCAILGAPGHAAGVRVAEQGECSLHDLMRAACDAGVRFKISPPATQAPAWDPIAEIAETVGGAYVISEAMNEDTVTFTY